MPKKPIPTHLSPLDLARLRRPDDRIEKHLVTLFPYTPEQLAHDRRFRESTDPVVLHRPRLRHDGEGTTEYRIALGWDQLPALETPMPKQNPAQTAAGLVRQWEDCIPPHDLAKWAEDAALTLRALVALHAMPAAAAPWPAITDAMLDAGRRAPIPAVHLDSISGRERLVLRAQIEAVLSAAEAQGGTNA